MLNQAFKVFAIFVVVIVWKGTDTPDGKVFVNTTDVKTAVKAVQRECPKAHIISVQRTKQGVDDVIVLEYTGTCDVVVAGGCFEK